MLDSDHCFTSFPLNSLSFSRKLFFLPMNYLLRHNFAYWHKVGVVLDSCVLNERVHDFSGFNQEPSILINFLECNHSLTKNIDSSSFTFQHRVLMLVEEFAFVFSFPQNKSLPQK